MTKLDSDISDIESMELDFELTSLRNKISKLETENYKLHQILRENDIEFGNASSPLSDEENICINEIRKLKLLSDQGQFTQEEAKTLDILYKNLRLIRGLSVGTEVKSKKNKSVPTAELFKIVSNE